MLPWRRRRELHGRSPDRDGGPAFIEETGRQLHWRRGQRARAGMGARADAQLGCGRRCLQLKEGARTCGVALMPGDDPARDLYAGLAAIAWPRA